MVPEEPGREMCSWEVGVPRAGSGAGSPNRSYAITPLPQIVSPAPASLGGDLISQALWLLPNL